MVERAALFPRWATAFRVVFVLLLLPCAPNNAGAAQDDQADIPPDYVKELEPFRVTGYHLKRLDVEGPAPVVVIEREAIAQSGVNTLSDFFRYLTLNNDVPSDLTNSPASGGAGFINLRGIGVDSTLTLVNGLRVAGYGWNGTAPFVDINAFPVAAIDRIEILKDGASAIYGADAIAGVVNIILRNDYVGSEASAGYQTTSKRDSTEWTGSLIHGWGNDRTHVLLSVNVLNREPLFSRQRAHSSTTDFSSQGGPNLGNFLSSPPTFVLYSQGVTVADPECGADPRVSTHVLWFLGEACFFNYQNFTSMIYDTERINTSVVVSRDMSGSMRLFGEAWFSRGRNISTHAPGPVLASEQLPTALGFPYVPANHPNNPFGEEGEVLGRTVDTPPRQFIDRSDNYRMVLGLEGATGRWDWQTTLMGSGNDLDTDRKNSVLTSRFQLALLGLGGPNGDLWYNPFGFQPENDPELLDWLSVNTRFGSDTSEHAIDATFSTTFGQLSGGAMGVAIGAQWREQSFDQWADELEQSRDLAGAYPLYDGVHGERKIASAYLELSLPLSESVEAQLAWRHEDYSDFGGTTNPKVALRWKPLESLMLRASWGTSFKAPSFHELHTPTFRVVNALRDVARCQVTAANVDCAYRPYDTTFSGNPGLQPEEGESRFLGLVWTPPFADGLVLDLGFWEFDHSERIIDFDPQQILDNLGDAGIVRAPPSAADLALGIPGPILQVFRTFRNSDVFFTRGVDLAMAYDWPENRAGRFNTAFSYTYLGEFKLEDTNLLGKQAQANYAGRYFNAAIPRHRANLSFGWQREKHAASATLHYVGRYQNWTNRWEAGVESNRPWTIEDHITLDLQYAHHFSNIRGAKLQIGCQNCTGAEPPVTFDPFGEYLHDERGTILYFRWQQPF